MLQPRMIHFVVYVTNASLQSKYDCASLSFILNPHKKIFRPVPTQIDQYVKEFSCPNTKNKYLYMVHVRTK
jgi:hypothetical protein